jgi:peptide/nickel transport system substrate-binding protein
MSHAIDRETLCERAHFGYAIPAYTRWCTGMFTFRENPDDYPYDIAKYDPDRAEELLDEAGVTGNPRMQLSILAPPARERELTVVQEMLRQVGIEVSLDIQQTSAFDANRYSYEWPIVATGAGGGDVDPQAVMWRNVGYPNPDPGEFPDLPFDDPSEAGLGVWSKYLWLNKECTGHLIQDYITPGTDVEQRRMHLDNAHKIVSEETATIPLTNPLLLRGQKESLSGVGHQNGLLNFAAAYQEE